MDQLARLFHHGSGDLRMAVAKICHSYTRRQIQILFIFHIRHPGCNNKTCVNALACTCCVPKTDQTPLPRSKTKDVMRPKPGVKLDFPNSWPVLPLKVGTLNPRLIETWYRGRCKEEAPTAGRERGDEEEQHVEKAYREEATR